jgi:hypothetical protein
MPGIPGSFTSSSPRGSSDSTTKYLGPDGSIVGHVLIRLPQELVNRWCECGDRCRAWIGWGIERGASALVVVIPVGMADVRNHQYLWAQKSMSQPDLLTSTRVQVTRHPRTVLCERKRTSVGEVECFKMAGIFTLALHKCWLLELRLRLVAKK